MILHFTEAFCRQLGANRFIYFLSYERAIEIGRPSSDRSVTKRESFELGEIRLRIVIDIMIVREKGGCNQKNR